MDLHKITALAHSHLIKRNCLQLGRANSSLVSSEGSVPQGVPRDRVTGPFAPTHCVALASLTGKEDAGGQKQYDETRELHRGFAGQTREKVG